MFSTFFSIIHSKCRIVEDHLQTLPFRKSQVYDGKGYRSYNLGNLNMALSIFSTDLFAKLPNQEFIEETLIDTRIAMSATAAMFVCFKLKKNKSYFSLQLK